MFGTAQPLDPQRDEDGGERGIGGHEDDRDGKQSAGDGLMAQDVDAVDEIAGYAADRGLAAGRSPRTGMS